MRAVPSSVRIGLAMALGLQLACSAPDAPPRAARAAPDVTTFTLEGDTVQLSSFRGQPVLLNLWATWCAPCRRETPYLQTLHERWADEGLHVVGVTLDRRGFEPEIRDFIAEFGVDYTILQDPDMVSMDRYLVVGLPATFLVDRDGIIRHAVTGPVAEGNRAFEAALREILE
jgi:cytochrome c biogenesis protein CcmG/thiol:disulfide interchange protein DsbE